MDYWKVFKGFKKRVRSSGTTKNYIGLGKLNVSSPIKQVKLSAEHKCSIIAITFVMVMVD